MVSGEASSAYTHGYSPMKHGQSVIDKGLHNKEIKTMQRSIEPTADERLKVYGKRKIP